MFLPWENAKVRKGLDGQLVSDRKSTFECEPHCQCTIFIPTRAFGVFESLQIFFLLVAHTAIISLPDHSIYHELFSFPTFPSRPWRPSTVFCLGQLHDDREHEAISVIQEESQAHFQQEKAL